MADKRYESGWVVAAESRIEQVSPKAWNVQSQTRPDEYYTVIEKHDGNLECNCTDFFYHGEEEICKHIWALIIKETT